MKKNIVEVEPGVFSVLDGNRSYEFRVEGQQVFYRGQGASLEESDEGSRRGVGSSRLSSPMPGKVIRVLVSEGQQVEAGQGLLVVEAMKMQNEMKAPRAGTVRNLKAVSGGTVAAGETIAVIE